MKRNLILSMMFLLCTLLMGCQKEGKQVIDFNDYVLFETKGYDGYGTISCSVDFEKAFSELSLTKEEKAHVIQVANDYKPFSFKYSKTDNLKNDDIITVSWEADGTIIEHLEKVSECDFKYDEVVHTVQGLPAIREYDPFKSLTFNTNNSASGTGSIEFMISDVIGDANIEWKVSHSGKNGELKNGDIVILTIEDEIDTELLKKQAGITLSALSDVFEITCLSEPAKDGSLMYHVSQENEAALNKVMEDWVVAGLNDENVFVEEKRTYNNVGYVFFTNNVPDSPVIISSEPNSMFISIYEVKDPCVMEPYYVFIGLKNNFAYDHNGIYLDDGSSLPNSFVYYEKETVRYSEQFGWRQGSEGMGFLYGGLAYAGHLTLQETVDFIEQNYGVNYTYKYSTNSIPLANTDVSGMEENNVEEVIDEV